MYMYLHMCIYICIERISTCVYVYMYICMIWGSCPLDAQATLTVAQDVPCVTDPTRGLGVGR